MQYFPPSLRTLLRHGLICCCLTLLMIITYDELQKSGRRKWVVAYLKVLSRHLPGGAEKTLETCHVHRLPGPRLTPTRSLIANSVTLTIPIKTHISDRRTDASFPKGTPRYVTREKFPKQVGRYPKSSLLICYQ
jgi:hypothetical protein